MNMTKCRNCCYSHHNVKNLTCEKFSVNVDPEGFCHAGTEKSWLPSNINKINKEQVHCKDCANRYNEIECPLVQEHETYDEDDGYDYFYTYGASEDDEFYCAYGELNNERY